MLGARTHRLIFLFGIMGLAFGMMIGTVPTSIPQIILLGNWLLEGEFSRKWSVIRSNKLFWLLSSVFFIHIIGLLYTADLNAGWNDVRTKSPLFILPLILMTSPALSKKEFHALLYCFVLGCLVNTLWCYLYTFVLHQNEGVRGASRFMSHIRLGLYLNMAICSCVYLAFQMRNLLTSLLHICIVIYFLFAMYALGLASGFANFCIIVMLIASYFAFKSGWIFRGVLVASLLLGFYLLASYVSNVYSEQYTLKDDPLNQKQTTAPSGRSYYHLPGVPQLENGICVQYNIQQAELKRAWNRSSPDDSISYVPLINDHRFDVLIRYMSSMGLAKDSAGFSKLTPEDIGNIRNNITNHKMPEWSFFHKRIHELVTDYEEFRQNRNANGHSLSMRLYFWKTALHMIGRSMWIGYGTGDVQAAMNEGYSSLQVPLTEEWHKRPHNQFITAALALGIPMAMIFVCAVFYPVWLMRKKLSLLFWPFFCMAIISFLLEDTLESQAGLTYFAFFNSVLFSQAASEGS